MDFISSSILGGLLWDSVKSGVPITLDYAKNKIGGYIFDDLLSGELEKMKQQIPIEMKKSRDLLVEHIEKEQEWIAISKKIISATHFTQNNIGKKAKGIQAENINIINM